MPDTLGMRWVSGFFYYLLFHEHFLHLTWRYIF